MKKEIFLNVEDEKSINEMIQSLIKSKAKETAFEDTGGLMVLVEPSDSWEYGFSFYRCFGHITISKKEAKEWKKKKTH